MTDIVERLPLPPLPKLTARLTVSDECDLYDWLQKHRETAVETATKNLHVALADTAEILSRYAERVDALRAKLAEKDKAVAKMIKACSDSGEMWTALCRVNLLLQGPDPAARAQAAANLVRSAIEKLEGQP